MLGLLCLGESTAPQGRWNHSLPSFASAHRIDHGEVLRTRRRRGRPVSLKVKIHTNGGLNFRRLAVHQIGSIPRLPQNIDRGS